MVQDPSASAGDGRGGEVMGMGYGMKSVFFFFSRQGLDWVRVNDF